MAGEATQVVKVNTEKLHLESHQRQMIRKNTRVCSRLQRLTTVPPPGPRPFRNLLNNVFNIYVEKQNSAEIKNLFSLFWLVTI